MCSLGSCSLLLLCSLPVHVVRTDVALRTSRWTPSSCATRCVGLPCPAYATTTTHHATLHGLHTRAITAAVLIRSRHVTSFMPLLAIACACPQRYAKKHNKKVEP